jgi:hypothetical protein
MSQRERSGLRRLIVRKHVFLAGWFVAVRYGTRLATWILEDNVRFGAENKYHVDQLRTLIRSSMLAISPFLFI